MDSSTKHPAGGSHNQTSDTARSAEHTTASMPATRVYPFSALTVLLVPLESVV
jgi:hypothetical protein